MMSLVVLIIVVQSWLSFAFAEQPVIPIAGLVMCVGCIGWFCSRRKRAALYGAAAAVGTVSCCAIAWMLVVHRYTPPSDFVPQIASQLFCGVALGGCVGVLVAALALESNRVRLGIALCGIASLLVGRTWQLLLAPVRDQMPWDLGPYMQAGFVGLIIGVDLVWVLGRLKSLLAKAAFAVVVATIVLAGMVYNGIDRSAGLYYTYTANDLAYERNVDALLRKVEVGNPWVEGVTHTVGNLVPALYSSERASDLWEYEYEERSHATCWLGENGGRRALPLMMRLARKQDCGAIYALGGIGDRQAVPLLLAMLKDETIMPIVRLNVVDALAMLNRRTRDKSINKALLAAIRNNSASVSERAAEAYTGSDSIPTFTRMLDDPDPRFRRTAVSGLGGRFSDAAVRLLLRALNDKDPSVRAAAASELGSQMRQSTAPALIHRLRDKDPSVQRAAFEALLNIQDKRAVPALEASRKSIASSYPRRYRQRVLDSMEKQIAALREGRPVHFGE